MFEISDKIKDNINDDVLPYLQRLNKRKSWNSESKENLRQLENLLKRNNYKSFVGHPNRYHLTRVGDSCLYDVPTYRKGALVEFRGQRVRVICMSSGRYDRMLMAGVVGKTPANKVKIKEKSVFVFPEIGDHEVVYLGRRYKLIQAKGEFPIPICQGSNEIIDLKCCNLILLDGKESRPIATFKYESDNKLTGLLVGWDFPEEFSEIHDAVKKMAKKSEQLRLPIFN
jgi:hypothetical protein